MTRLSRAQPDLRVAEEPRGPMLRTVPEEAARDIAARRSEAIGHALRLAAAWLFFGLAMATFELSGVRLSTVFRDTAELAGFPFYFGVLSNVGALVWGAGAFIPFFASFLVRNSAHRSLLRWGAILTFVLLVDDFLMIHDGLMRQVLHLPEYPVFILYGLVFPWFLLRHRQVILQETRYRILAFGLVLPGISILIDLDLLPGGIAAEDGFKICGIVAYAYYWILTAKQMLSAEMAPSRA